MDARYWINKLCLLQHPEGGWFSENYRSDETCAAENLPTRYKEARSFGTSIYFLLESNDFSAFHRLKSDELWHFYDGSPLKVFRINNEGELHIDLLSSTEKGLPFLCIPRETWFAAEVVKKNSFTLIGCTVSPGFDFNDFELGDRKSLITNFPHHSDIINKLTR
jgi:uncharacterized protein